MDVRRGVPGPGRSRVVLAIQLAWSLGFLIGTTTHVLDLLAGPDVYQGQPPAVRGYWVALTVADPLTVVLVWLRRRAGVVLGVAIMVSDVAVNASVLAAAGALQPSALAMQGLFALVVLVTAPVLWRAYRPVSRRRRPAPPSGDGRGPRARSRR